MGTGRDDFSSETIRKAAGRVGYRCSFPGCHNATIGASMESCDKTAITGVAAHICAAAEGGPRYDKNMTVKERKSIENCIWLCQTHSKLIDTDVETYTVEKLRQWKFDAEVASSQALANGDYFGEYYIHNGDNLDILKQMFDDMIVEGQFSQLHTMLAQYKTKLSEQYEEFVLRYKIVYDVYCDRSMLNSHLEEYCNLVCKNGADTLMILFLAFNLKNELGKIVEFCTSEELKKYAKMAIKDELANLFIVPVVSAKTIQLSAELGKVISKHITNYIIQNKIIGAVDVTGAKYAVFSDEFYYRAVKAAYELACESIYENGYFEDIVTCSDFRFIKDNIDKITLLDASLQEYIWTQFLTFLSEKPKEFEFYYKQCPQSLKDAPSIEKAYYIYRINGDVRSIECNALVAYVSRTGDNSLLCMYLSTIERSAAIEFLDEHGYLLKQDSVYLKLRLDLLSNIQPEESRDILLKYNEIYADNFTFHLLLAKYANSKRDLDNELKWLKLKKDKMKLHDGIDYIRILHERQCWADLVELTLIPLPNEYAFILASYLSESEDISNTKISFNLYQKLINKGWKRRGLHFNMGVTQCKLGYFEKAKESFQNEYDVYTDPSSLRSLIQLRYELNEYETDCYFERFKGFIDANSQNIIAAIYLKRCNYSDARKYFLRSLLLKDDKNPSITGLYLVVSHIPSKAVNVIESNVFCVLKNNTHEQYIAIHDPDILEGIVSPNTFASYSHYSVQDVRISPLLFAAQGDTVIWNDQEYTVGEIISANDAIKRFFFSTLSKKEGVKLISTSSVEDFVAQISRILQESSDDLNKYIDQYNQLEIRLPLSILSTATGKGMLKTCEFLAFKNCEKIRNNVSVTINMNDIATFVLSYDAIVNLTHLGVETDLLHQFDLMCSQQVKNQLINDVNEELSELTNESQKGTMFIEDGKLTIFERTPDMRRSRHAFLVRLKSFVESVRVSDNMPTFTSNNAELNAQLEKLFSNKQLYCESTSLAATKYIPGAALVTDDQFLFVTANTDAMPTVGLTGLLSKSNLPWEILLAASKKLKGMNYSNYLPVHLYQRIVDQMLASCTEFDTASEEIQTWILSDTDGEATSHHEDVIIALYRKVVEEGFDYLNPENYLAGIVLGILEKRNPGFIKNCISDAYTTLISVDH